MAFESVQPVPIGGGLRRSGLLLPEFFKSQFPVDTHAHRVDIALVECSRPLSRDRDLARSCSATVASLDHSYLRIGRSCEERRQSVGLVQVVVVPKADVTTSCLANPDISRE